MNLEIIKVVKVDKSVLRQLMELYLYDFSEYDQADVDEHGLFGYDHLDAYWTEEDRYPYFIRVDGKLAGFVLVSQHTEVVEAGTGYSISEFFVMKKYRQSGIGKAAATEVFERHPGRWEVRQYLPNKPSLVFWEKVIDSYTQGNFTKQTITVDDWEEQVIIFDNSK